MFFSRGYDDARTEQEKIRPNLKLTNAEILQNHRQDVSEVARHGTAQRGCRQHDRHAQPEWDLAQEREDKGATVEDDAERGVGLVEHVAFRDNAKEREHLAVLALKHLAAGHSEPLDVAQRLILLAHNARRGRLVLDVERVARHGDAQESENLDGLESARHGGTV